MEITRFLRKILAYASHHGSGQVIILWSIDHMSTFLPIQRLRETEHIIAFHHPEPTYPLHILIIPKQPIKQFMDLSSSDNGLIMEMIQVVQTLVEELNLDHEGYRLIVNGGKYQSLPRLHFHLVSGNAVG
jgi:histidine triad (HIT) family protein